MIEINTSYRDYSQEQIRKLTQNAIEAGILFEDALKASTKKVKHDPPHKDYLSVEAIYESSKTNNNQK